RTALAAAFRSCVAARLHAEITEETLQRMIVRKLIEAGRAKELTTVTAIGSLLDIFLYTHADNCRTNLLDQIGKTRCLRRRRYLHGVSTCVVEHAERTGRHKTT